ncbi:hypothetical protein ABMC89_18510, partial [Sulfitobacter sp. HNIBRBA3233]|uniref:hypothetical protein n=1 Tax=Sulfitobacter marinivivus TaxID=3158558 RepID=UPI0032DE95E1
VVMISHLSARVLLAFATNNGISPFGQKLISGNAKTADLQEGKADECALCTTGFGDSKRPHSVLLVTAGAR